MQLENRVFDVIPLLIDCIHSTKITIRREKESHALLTSGKMGKDVFVFVLSRAWDDEKILSSVTRRKTSFSISLQSRKLLIFLIIFTKMLKYFIVPPWSLSLSILSVNKPLYTNDSLTTAYSGLSQDLRLTQAMAYVRYTARYIH